MFELEERKISVEEAVGIIEEIKTEVSQMGGNDSEIPDLMRIIEGVRKGEIGPEEGIVSARRILSFKEDYH